MKNLSTVPRAGEMGVLWCPFSRPTMAFRMKPLIAHCLLFGLLVGAVSSAQVQGPNLAITNFSVWSTLPGPDGQRRMAISFRVVNTGIAAAGASTTRITVAGTATTFPTPALAIKGAAFFSNTLETKAPQVAIKIETNISQPLVNAPLALDRRILPPGLVASEANGPSNMMKYTANPAGDYGRWESIGPSKIATNPGESGRVTTIAVSPIDASTIYAGGRDEGLWKTEGANTTWFPVADALPTQEIDAVALDPGNPNRVMVVTPMGVFQSLNGGAMWQQLNNKNLSAVGSDGGKLLITNTQPTNRNPNVTREARAPIVGVTPTQAHYVTTSRGLQVSTDGGVNWNPVLASASPIISLQFGTTDASQMFASTAKPPAAYEAQNGGLSSASWHQLQGCPQAPLPSFPADANVWITESQGTQWISFRGSTTDSPSLGLWRSTGDSCSVNGFPEHGWEQIPITAPCDDYTNQWSYLFAHPEDPTVVFKGGIDLCRSSASGDNMTRVSGIHADHHAVVVAPSSPSVMFFGSDGGIYRSTDKGVTLSFFGEGMSNTEFLKIDVNGAGAPRVIVGGTQDNDSSAWDGISAVWTDIGAALSSGDVPLIAFDRKDDKGVYVMGQSTQQIQDYPASGSSQITQRGSLVDCNAYSEFPGKVFESMESTGATPPLMVTCNGIWSGPPWNQIKTPNPSDTFVRLQLAPDNPEIAVAATAKGHVYWGLAQQPSSLYDVFTAPNNGTPSAITVASETTFYVANNANNQGIITRFICLFGCTTENIWPQTQTPAGDVTALGIDPLGTDTVLAAIQGNGIFQGTRASSGQWTWVPYTNGIPVGANVVDIEARKDGSIAAATYGRGVFLLTSRSTAPPPPPTLSAIGHVVAFESEGGHSPLGKPIPKITIARLDSKPGFVFTTLSLAGTGVLAAAFENHRKVQITYTPNGANSGKILSASYAGP
jgi:hypothetical protein